MFDRDVTRDLSLRGLRAAHDRMQRRGLEGACQLLQVGGAIGIHESFLIRGRLFGHEQDVARQDTHHAQEQRHQRTALLAFLRQGLRRFEQ